MENSTLLEDLSNEIFCEIFDYLNALDLFWAFASLNSRISSILKLIRLHVRIREVSFRRQIELLSQHLIFQSDQVISLDICDEICDQSNVIEYLFGRHGFPNLRSCILWAFDASCKMKNVLRQLKKQTQLTSFHILERYNTQCQNRIRSHAHLFSKEILLDAPSTLRQVTLRIHYHYPELMSGTVISTNLTYLELIFWGTHDTISIYALVPILRIHRSLRKLYVIIQYSTMSQDNNIK